MRVPLEWLKDFVDIRMKPEGLAHALTMGGLEVEAIERVGREAIFEVAVTPNRGDCLSITGVAREVAAVTGARLKASAYKPPRGTGRTADFIRIRVRHPSRCPRYAARVVGGVRIGPSPSWMVKRLAASGVRSINNVVDATNYVMMETGQPLHAFDLRFVRGGQIVVQMAGSEMNFGTLDGEKRSLVPEDLLICDGLGPVAIAGVMGGENSEVRASTTRILLESAYFEPAGVRRTSKRLGLSSESSRRFERGVDPNGTLAALHRLTALIVETAGGAPAADWIDIYPKRILPRRIAISEDEVERILGLRIGAARIERLLARLGLAASKGARLLVTVPTFRADIERPIDLIEEIARIHGYDEIPETMPTVKVAPLLRPRFMDQEEGVRDALAGAGLSEAVLYGFTSASSLEPFAELITGEVRITNPLSAEQGVMRTTLLPGLLDAARLNLSRQCADLRLFALQSIFHRPMAIGPSEEPRHAAGIMIGRRYPGAWERSREMLDFYDAKGVVEALLESLGLAETTIYQRGEAYGFLHPGAFAYVICTGRRVGFVGQLHPDVAAKWDITQEAFVFELKFEVLAELSMGQATRFSEYSRFPFVERDLALVVEERIPAVEVEKAIQDCGVDLISSARIFDVYRGDGVPHGKKSLAIAIRFARSDRTLTDDEVQAAQARIVGELKTRLGAELRT